MSKTRLSGDGPNEGQLRVHRRTAPSRGRPSSAGRSFLTEATDGYDTIEWAASLPKSNGRVGMYGFSYPGASQWLAATLRY